MSAPIGPRSTVATGPDLIEAAQWEFKESTEAYLQAVEKIVSPYQWGQYNALVLPSSFPYGGMENPVYSFITPSVISYDRENVDVIAHEMSHSWSGNLVTAAAWEDFWLNEGWTTYLERRLQAALFGEAHRDFSAIIGWKALVDSVESFGSRGEFTKLKPNLHGKAPDDAFSSVPYEKGYTFLSYLENTLGKAKWNKYIPHYFTGFARQSLTSDDFKRNLNAFFEDDAEASRALGDVNWDKWFYEPGLPPRPDFDTSMVEVCYHLASKWEHLRESNFKPTAEDITGWRANQMVVFLNSVEQFEPPLDKELVELMGETYGLLQSRNLEVTSRYYGIGLQSRLEKVYPLALELLSNVGRIKFVRPL